MATRIAMLASKVALVAAVFAFVVEVIDCVVNGLGQFRLGATIASAFVLTAIIGLQVLMRTTMQRIEQLNETERLHHQRVMATLDMIEGNEGPTPH